MWFGLRDWDYHVTSRVGLWLRGGYVAAELQVRLFGDVSIQQDGRTPSFPSGKALELFCYLLIYRDRAHTRETLSEVLWPGGRSAAIKKYLRQALWQLNRAVRLAPDHHRGAAETPVITDPGWVRINPNASWWLDVSMFERAYFDIRDTPGRNLSVHQARDLESALDLYRGDLLAAWYCDWCIRERDRLQLIYLAMLDQLIGYCDAQRLYAKGLGLGQIVLRLDPARESTHRQLMRLHYQAGDRASAIRQYEHCASVMSREFGVQPSAGTIALHAQIRADRVPDLHVPSFSGPVVPDQPDNTASADLHVRLDQIHATLLALYRSVLHDSGARSEHAANGPLEAETGH